MPASKRKIRVPDAIELYRADQGAALIRNRFAIPTVRSHMRGDEALHRIAGAATKASSRPVTERLSTLRPMVRKSVAPAICQPMVTCAPAGNNRLASERLFHPTRRARLAPGPVSRPVRSHTPLPPSSPCKPRSGSSSESRQRRYTKCHGCRGPKGSTARCMRRQRIPTIKHRTKACKLLWEKYVSE